MVTHVVLFKLREPTPDNLLTVANALRSMEGKIAALLSIDVGIDELRTERSFDVALRTTHATYADLEVYQVDPLHQSVVALIKSLAEKSVACDWSS